MSIIIVEPTSSGVALVAAARRSGHAVHLFARDGAELSAPCKAMSTSIIEVDTNDADAMETAARSLMDRLAHATDSLVAIVPGFEYVVDRVAEVGARLGLPHLRADAAALTRNKFLCREHLRRNGFDVPRYASILDPTGIEQAASEVGFPAVVKPVDGCGSLLVRKVNSLMELREAMANADRAQVVDMGLRIGSQFLLEEFLEGREFSIEGHVERGVPHIVAVTEKQLGPEPFFVEMGHVVPAEMHGDDREVLIAYIDTVVRTIGINLGAFHAEARLTSRGPILIEIAARLGGDRIYRLVELAHGASLPDLMISSYCGAEPAAVAATLEQEGVAGIRFLSGQSMGMGMAGDRTDVINRVRTMPGFQEVEVYFAPGESIPELTDFRGRSGHVLFRADDRAALDVALKRAEQALASNDCESIKQREGRSA